MRNSPFAIAMALVGGIVFGLGLAISQMIDPEKVKNFLDLAAITTGGWDPSLAFVMAAGSAVAFVGLRFNRFMRKPVAAPAFQVNTKTWIDRRLVIGSAIFGVGWGISGFCPGPAIANLGVVPDAVAIFVAAMLAGSWLTGAIVEWSNRSSLEPSQAVAK